MMTSSCLFVFFTFLGVGLCSKFNDSWYTTIPRNDMQRCPQNSNVMEVLPGVGFDSLNNKEMGRVLAVNFSRCSASLDRKYLIPDFVDIVPLKQSQVQLFSELIDHWQNYSSTTSKSINVDASGSFVFGSISGSFSWEHQSMKQRMAEDKSVTVRTQLRHTFYRVQAQPDSELEARCHDRLLDIASYIQRNDSYMTTYLSQLFVRDFGTHVTTNVDAGAVIAQTDQVNSNFVETFNEDKSKITAAASASFLGVFNVGASFSTSTDTKTTTEYMKNRRESRVDTIGGPPFRANFTLNDWEHGIDDALVPVDKSGDPIWFVITRASLPELPQDTIQQLVDAVTEAVRQYYLHNLHRGCTTSNSKNYNPTANFDDGQCEPPTTNYTFGGVYQTCDGPDDFCSKNRQTNPKTRTYSCPQPYQAQLLYSFQGPRECTQHCHGWFIFRRCDWTCTHGVVNAYWCYALSKVPQESGYLFGGVYTDTTVNLVTQEKTCPKMFYPLMIVGGHVCVSDDYELGFRYSYPFGGFISCNQGNPLAHSASVGYQNKANSLKSFFADKKNSHPKHCPKGYSQHLMQISHGCEINYCVRKNAFSDTRMPILRRPPYVKKPVPVLNDTMYLMTPAKRVLKKVGALRWDDVEVRLVMADRDAEIVHRDNTSSSRISLGGTVALTMFGTILAALLIGFLIAMVTRRSRMNEPYQLRDEAPPVTYTGGGGSGSESISDVCINTETSRLVV